MEAWEGVHRRMIEQLQVEHTDLLAVRAWILSHPIDAAIWLGHDEDDVSEVCWNVSHDA